MKRPRCIQGRTAVPALAIALLSAPATVLAQIGTEFRANTYTTAAQRLPAAAATSGFEEFILVWESASQDGDQYGVFAQRYAAWGVPSGPEFRVNTYTTASQHAPAVASKRSPNVIVAWQSDGQDGDQGGVYAQRLEGSTGVPFGPEFRLNSYTTSSQAAPAVGADSSGNFVVVWASQGQDGSDYGIFGQRYASTGLPLGGEFRVNSYTTGFQGHPAVGVDPTQGFVVVWEGQGADDQPFGIFGQRYSAAGTPMGGEFRVNSFTTGHQRYPAVEGGPRASSSCGRATGRTAPGMACTAGHSTSTPAIRKDPSTS